MGSDCARHVTWWAVGRPEHEVAVTGARSGSTGIELLSLSPSLSVAAWADDGSTARPTLSASAASHVPDR